MKRDNGTGQQVAPHTPLFNGGRQTAREGCSRSSTAGGPCPPIDPPLPSVSLLQYSLRRRPFASEPWNPALAARHNETAVEAQAHLLPCYSMMTFAPCLQSYSAVFFIEKCITSSRSQENQFISCSLWVWRVMVWLLSSRKMYIFSEVSDWWFFFFISPLSLHQGLIWIHARWHPSPFYCRADVAPSFYSLLNSYVWMAMQRGHNQPAANPLLGKSRTSKAAGTTNPTVHIGKLDSNKCAVQIYCKSSWRNRVVN